MSKYEKGVPPKAELPEHFLSVKTYPSFGKCTTLIKLSHALFLGTSHASSLYSLLRLLSLRQTDKQLLPPA